MTDNVLPMLRSALIQRYDQIKQSLSIQLGNAELAGDALHEVWLRLQRDGHVAGPVANPQAYLVRMGVNLAIDIRRSQSRMLSVEDLQELMSVIPDPAPGPAQIAEARSELEALKAVVNEMPARRREILLLVRWEHWPQREVAKRLGVSLRTVECELKTAQEYCAARLLQRQ
ncbi:RNA polymerase sigma factor [Variovorax sp. LT1R16]|uniref:RNA polymerase sigma factor n=1 Tax=Variovorax sp. LT1R16 TaxID=3443728 RepID=UPI003F45BE45